MRGNNESWKNFINIEISTHLLPCDGWFCPVSSEPVEPYFTRFLRTLTFCLEVSIIVIFKENGVVGSLRDSGYNRWARHIIRL